METTSVRVRSVSDEEAQAVMASLMLKQLGKHRQLDTSVLSILAEFMPDNPKFLIEWSGSDDSLALSGVGVGVHKIGALDETVVRSVEGQAIGTYERVLRYGGDSANEHRVLITLFESS